MHSTIERLPIEQDTPEWHQLRKNQMGGSDAPIIMGKSPFKTPYQLWQEKLGFKTGSVMTEAMRRGKELEPIAREAFIKETGIQVKPAVIKNSLHPHMMASMDGISDCGRYAVEIKIPGRVNHEMTVYDGVIPHHYHDQLLHQMIVCNLEKIFYYSWNEDSSKIIEVAKNYFDEAILVNAERDFWDKVQNLEQPDFVDADFTNMDGNKEWLILSDEWKKAKECLKHADKQEKELREKLIKLADNHNARGNGIKLSRFFRKGSVDYSAVPQLNGIDLEAYRKEHVEVWRCA
jgi:putative phage-type endonuclease